MKSRLHRKFVSRPRNVGAALVVTLALVVLITTLLLAFFINSTLNGQLEVSSTSRVETNIIARSALELIVADLKQEMAAGSGMAGEIMVPSTNADNLAMRPSRVLADTGMLTNPAFDTLIKQSVSGSAFFPSTAPYTNNGISPKIGPASTINTLSAARNNRKVSLTRWNFPALLSSNGFTSAAQTPNWVYLGKDGITNGASSDIVGRFAFNVYNVGGRLNVNIAGYPTGLTLEQQEMIKGTPIGAILQNKIPGLLNANAFINWRNSASSAQSPTNFVSSILADTNGFSQPLAGDNRFISRQDLIRYVRLNPTVISTNALPYLTTFSLERNTPSWGPMTNGVAAAYSYVSQSTDVISTNRLLPTARKASGDPLISKRFALSALGSIPAFGEGLAGPIADQILEKFGLQWESPVGGAAPYWKYIQKTATGGIATLGEVAAQNREPNFFELLKAVVLRGALGKDGGVSASDTVSYDQNPDYQIVQIGVNLIDQYRSDDLPTRVKFDDIAPVFGGVVDLPYLNKIIYMMYRPPANSQTALGVQGPERWILGSWLVPEFWRLHKRSFFSSASSNQKVRMRMLQGNMTLVTNDTWLGVTTYADISNETLSVDANGSDFRNVPNVVRGGATTSTPFGLISDPGGFSQLYGLTVAFSDRFVNYGFLSNTSDKAMRGAAIMPRPSTGGDGVSIALEVESDDGWLPYDTMKNLQPQNSQAYGIQINKFSSYQFPDFENIYLIPRGLISMVRGYTSPPYTGNALLKAIPISSIARADLRTDRFGVASFMGTQLGFLRAPLKLGTSVIYYDPNDAPRESYPSNDANGYVPASGGMRARGDGSRAANMMSSIGQMASDGWFNVKTGGAYPGNFPGALTDNKPNANPGALYYNDRDGIQRRALGAYSSFYMDDASRAPIMLNRRFFSVADIGYAHRGEPWKNLDLFTKESADAGLLDLFTTTDQGKVTEGKIDLNSAPKEVISAYLDGAIENEVAGTAISSTTADSIAEAIYNEARQKPFVNKSELVTRFGDTSPLRTAINNPDKARHEAYLRGLADNVQTRTWNLMIDVIAQKGRLATASNLGSFMVEGERRYWLHIAIDRFTGEIVGQRLEAVYE